MSSDKDNLVITPKEWGPWVWSTMYVMTMDYNPDTQKDTAKQFFTSLAGMLPCNICRHDFTELLKTHPLTDNDLASAETLFKWVNARHNQVRAKLGKDPMTMEDVLIFLRDRSFPAEPTLSWTLILILAIVCIVVGVCVCYLCTNTGG